MKQRIEPHTQNTNLTGSYQAAFVQAYRTYYPRIFAFVYSRTRNVELAKDLTAETFEKAYLKGPTVRNPEAYRSWLFTIAKNAVMGHYRRHKREINNLDNSGDALWLVEQPTGPEDSAIQRERMGHIMNHLRTLPQRDQELLALKFDGELTYAEIAQITGMTEGNARVAVFRALQRLRDRVQEEIGDDQGPGKPASLRQNPTMEETPWRRPVQTSSPTL